eukprot:scaffold7535_cov63-Attheya_sp.AAC.2
MPGTNPAAAAAAAAGDLIDPATLSRLAPLADSQQQPLYQLADIFSSITHPNQLTEPTESASRPTILAPVSPKLKVTFQIPTNPSPGVNKIPNQHRKDTPWPRPADTVATPRVNTVPSPNKLVVTPEHTVSPPKVVAVPTSTTKTAPPPRVAIVPKSTRSVPPPRVVKSKAPKTKSMPTNAPKSKSKSKPTNAPTARLPKKQPVRVPIAPISVPANHHSTPFPIDLCLHDWQYGKGTSCPQEKTSTTTTSATK